MRNTCYLNGRVRKIDWYLSSSLRARNLQRLKLRKSGDKSPESLPFFSSSNFIFGSQKICSTTEMIKNELSTFLVWTTCAVKFWLESLAPCETKQLEYSSCWKVDRASVEKPQPTETRGHASVVCGTLCASATEIFYHQNKLHFRLKRISLIF